MAVVTPGAMGTWMTDEKPRKVRKTPLRDANPGQFKIGEEHAELKKRYNAKFKHKERRAIAMANYPPCFRLPTDNVKLARSQETRYRNALAAAKQDASVKQYWVNGRIMDRYEVMGHIVMLVSEGMSLPEVVKADRGIPPVMEVRRWEERHPGFKDDLKRAEAARGEILNAERKRLVMDANMEDDKGNVNAQILKLKAQVLSEDAAFSNSKFQPKTLSQHEDITERVNRKEALEELKRLIEANPELRSMMTDVDEVVEGQVIRDELSDGVQQEGEYAGSN